MKTFRDASRKKDRVITAALPLRSTSNASDIRGAASILAPVVDAVQVGDNRYAPGHMSPLAAASIVLESGLDAVVSLSCRDRNRIALQADILGAAALGVSSLLLMRGEKLYDKADFRGKGVFDIGVDRLIEIARQAGDDERLVSEPGFYLGAPATVFEPAEDWEAARIVEKLDAGVRFLQTQPCLNADLLRRYVGKLIERKVMHRASFVVEVPLLTSAQEATALRETHKGSLIPDATVKRIAAADDPAREGVSVCAEMLAELQEVAGVSGMNIHCSGDPQGVVAAVHEAGLVSPE